MRSTIIIETTENALKVLNENKGKTVFFKVVDSKQNYTLIIR